MPHHHLGHAQPLDKRCDAFMQMIAVIDQMASLAETVQRSIAGILDGCACRDEQTCTGLVHHTLGCDIDSCPHLITRHLAQSFIARSIGLRHQPCRCGIGACFLQHFQQLVQIGLIRIIIARAGTLLLQDDNVPLARPKRLLQGDVLLQSPMGIACAETVKLIIGFLFHPVVPMFLQRATANIHDSPIHFYAGHKVFNDKGDIAEGVTAEGIADGKYPHLGS